MDKLQMRALIIKRIEQAVIADVSYSVLEFGAVSDSAEIQTQCFQRAIDTVSQKGGGRVCVPSGTYRVGALHLKSGVALHLESRDTVLSFVNEELSLHYPLVFTHWEATPCYNYSPLIYAYGAHDIAVTGKGVLDGGADWGHWWNWHHQVEEAWSADKTDLQLADRRALRQMNLDGVPVAERVFGQGHFLRPCFVQPVRCKRVLIQGVTVKNSPMWQLNPVMCESVVVDGVTLSSHGANNDGCDPESCSGVHITNCRFDTGDDCISLKAGRDRDGREADMPCEYVLIEGNNFADGHGGVALGSEMSGGIRYVLAWNNRFCSPNLTYALRLKTNAKRGGAVEDIIMADSVMDHVHGAAVHGTMLYEDGRNGSSLPRFRNIAIENITAHGGDYGIFLEAFAEVPITGLVLRNIRIDGVDKAMRSMNWEHAVVENVEINGKRFPRPAKVRILGVPAAGAVVRADAEIAGGTGGCMFTWEASHDRNDWAVIGTGAQLCVLEELLSGRRFLRVAACDVEQNVEYSHIYRILDKAALQRGQEVWQRLMCKGIVDVDVKEAGDTLITRGMLARMLLPFAQTPRTVWDMKNGALECMEIAIKNGFLVPDDTGDVRTEAAVTRQEMATVAMQACGVNYRNASTTMPVCADADLVGSHYGTNVARALYFGFMKLDGQGHFAPQKPMTLGETAAVLDRVADFAGI